MTYIRITKAGLSTYWYAKFVGEVFEAEHTFHSGDVNWEVTQPNGKVGYVDAVDSEEIEIDSPNSWRNRFADFLENMASKIRTYNLSNR